MKIYKILILTLLIGVTSNTKAQELSTLGKTFWMTFMESIGTPNNAPELKIVISCNKATTGTVKNIITNQSRPFSIGVGGGLDTVLIPTFMGYTTGSEASSSRSMGLLIQAADTISVSAQNTKTASCDAALIYPIEGLGLDYRVVSFPGDIYGSNNSYRSSFAIVATENNTDIDITPSSATSGGKAANSTFTITLQKGETYQVLASSRTGDMSGTFVQAKDCKKIAVFGGSTRSVVLFSACSGFINSADHLYEQMMPTNIWGKKFAMIPTTWQPNTLRKYELVKIVTTLPSTRIVFNGRAKVLPSAGMTDTFYIQTSREKEAIIIANKPIAICQIGLSQKCDGGSSDTDPMLMWLTPLEQTLKNLNFSCEKADKIDKFFVNIVVKTQYKGTLKIDASLPTATWKTIVRDTSYSYIQQSGLASGNHNISCPFGFSGILYAYGDYGSYGYNVGSSIKPLSFYTIANGKLSSEFEADSAYFNVCQGTTIPFDGGASTAPSSWKWVFSDGSTPKTTKSFTKVFNTPGTYTIDMIARRTTNGTCNGNNYIDDTVRSEIRVFAKPIIKLMNDTIICRGNKFTINSTTDGDTNFTFLPATWLNCTKCQFPVVKPIMDTTYTVSATSKGCLPSRDTFSVKIRDSIFLTTSTDTAICRGTSTTLTASSIGGLVGNHVITWDNGLGIGLSKVVSPMVTTTYRAILTDACTKDANDSFYADTNYITVTVLDSLKITMPNDTVVCEGNDVTLTAKVVGGRTSTHIVNWDNSLGAGFTKTITMSVTTSYKAVFEDGCTVPKDSGIVTVTVRPSIKIDTIIFNNPVCKNAVFTAKVKASGGDTTVYKFYLYNTTTGTNVLIDSAKNVTSKSFNLNIPDDSKFNVVMKQGCNTQQVSKKFNVKIKTGLSVNSTVAADTVCVGQNYTIGITGASADLLPIKFVLKRKNGVNWVAVDSTINLSAANFVVTAPTVTLTDYLIVGNDNCSRSDSSTFRLMRRAPLTLSKIRDTSLCRNETQSYTANAVGGKTQSITYNWTDLNYATLFGANKAVTLSPTNSMKVKLNVSDGCSSPLVDSALIMVAPLVTNSILATDIAGCEPYKTEFTFPTTQAQTPYNPTFTWLWNFDATTLNVPSTAGQVFPNIPKSYPNSGIYQTGVQMQLSNGVKCLPIYTQQIDVYKQATANFDYMPKLIDVVDPDVTFTNMSQGSTIHFWHYDDTFPGIYEQIDNPVHRFEDTGEYTITLIATNVNGCADTVQQKLIVKDIYRIFIPSAFSPNSDDFNTTWYPRITSTQSAELSVFNRWGEKVYQSNDGSGKWNGRIANSTIDCPEGVYYYHLKIRDTRKKWHYYNGTLTLLR